MLHRIVVWDPDQPERTGDVTVVLAQDVASAKEWVAVGLTEASCDWYELTNVDRADAGTFAWLLRYSVFGEEPAIVEGGRCETHHFFEVAERVVRAVRAWDDAGFAAAVALLDLAQHPLHLGRAGTVIDILRLFVEGIVSPTLAGCWCGPSPDEWFAGTAQFGQSVQLVRTTLEGTGAEFVAITDGLLESTRAVQRRLAQWNGLTDEGIALAIARYCYALARHPAHRSRSTLGLLLSHRSLDAFLLSLCFAEGIAVPMRSGPTYARPDLDRTHVGPVNSHFYLRRHNVIGVNRQREAWVNHLNKARNVLLLAHGTNGAQEAAVGTHLDELRRFAKSVRSDDSWEQIAAEFLKAPRIGLDAFLAVERGLDSFVRPLALEAPTT